MILIDFNQVLFAAVFANYNKEAVTEDFLRHIVLNTLRSYSKRFRGKYGKMVLCCENGSWRKSVFPFYKANRKADRESSSDIDWAFVFSHFNKFRQEFAENLPYKVVSAVDAEADDIIAVLVARYSPTEKMLIVSSDKDFGQLQKYSVDQYHPMKEMFVSIPNPALHLKEHIIRGDRKDGIPNILSPDNSFVIKQRQKNINKVKLQQWLSEPPSVFCNDTMLRGFTRNQMLIDFDYIPSRVTEGIIESFENTNVAPKMNLLPYLITNNLKLLIEVCDEF